MDIAQLDLILLLGSAVLLVAVLAVRLAATSGFPTLLLYLGLGLLLGESGLGIQFEDAELTGALGYAALIVILAEGGLTTRWDAVKPAVPAAALLATVGTVVSIGVTGAAARVLFDVGWADALLLGAVVSSTDAAAVFSVLRKVPIPARLSSILEAESGFNDAPVVIAVVSLVEVIDGHAHTGPALLLVEAALELAIGAVVGVGIGRGGAWALRRAALPGSGLYPITVLGLAVGAYAVAAVAHGSGFLAAYLSALVLGNARLPHRAAVRGFAEGMGWIAQIGLFVLLGLLASPARLVEQVPEAVALGLVLLLLARPLSVVVSLAPFRFGWRQQVFLSWAGLRGAVPIVLATAPMAAGVSGSERLFDLVFVLVVVFTLVQAPTLPWVARRLGIASTVTAVGLDVEASPLGALDADVLHVRLTPQSRLHGVELFELRLPEGTNVTLIVREGRSFVPHPRTMLRHGDDVIVVVPSALRGPTERRLRAVSAGGRLATWDKGRRRE